MMRAAGLVVVALVVVACGPARVASSPTIAERHLVYQEADGDTIVVADVDGADPRPLGVNGRTPTISPDGRWVTYSGRCLDGDTSACDTLYIVPTSGEDEPRRLSTIVSGFDLVWSSDSKWIVGHSRFKLLRIEVSSGKAAEVAAGKFAGWSISPDGKQVVFSRYGKPDDSSMYGYAVDLFVSDSDGGEARRITETGDAVDPVWGPKSIAFSKLISCLPSSSDGPPLEGCANNTWGRHELWSVQPDGTGLQPITAPVPDRFQMSGCVGLSPVDWSADGARLLAAWECEFSADPIAVDVADEEMRRLGKGVAVSLSGDGRFALVDGLAGAEPAPETQQVLIYPFRGGRPEIAARRSFAPSWNR